VSATTVAWLRSLAVAAGVIALDQISKAIVVATVERGAQENVFLGINVVNVRNTGVAFSLFSGSSQWIVILLAAAALIALLVYFGRHATRPLAWLPVGLLIGGAIGNFIDRIRIGAVVDFIDVSLWPAFNLADTSIVLGVLSLLYVLDGRPRKRGRDPEQQVGA
jgi:signal peptidase II